MTRGFIVTTLTDGCADLGQQLLDEHHLRSIPLHVLVGREDHLDGTLRLDALFSHVEQTGELPRAAAPAAQEFLSFFNIADPKVITGLSAKLSAAMPNAILDTKAIAAARI
ncbi:MAG: DegV family protein [Chloroflexota bacterium]|nr:DegV family protein [Chloroflexota bacterium]